MPLAILCIVGGLITMAAIASDQIEVTSPALLFASGLVVYAASLFLLAKAGLPGGTKSHRSDASEERGLLPSRRALHEDVRDLVHSEDEIAVALIDLDSFKLINDHYGHAVGDALIQSCARVLREACGDEARCYRLGGDEFAAVMSGPAAGTILEGMCRSMLEQLASPVDADGRDILVGASVGLARSTPADPQPSSELLRRADVAMTMSKRGGKMRCTWFNPSFDQRREAVREIEDDLRQAIEHEELGLLYQPLVDAETGHIAAVEALLRWQREDGREIGPNTFIPVAEESGLINPIGLWVLRKAMSDALRWEGITLSVNISAAQLRNPEFPIKLGEILEQTGFPPARLELEVTETCLVLDPVVAERSLDVIRGFGVDISLDDFGTGYASIGFLRQFRFEKLKLDRSLVINAEDDDGSRAMMLSSIAMARALKMGVTAEGVETIEQADMVRLAGADQIQGWLFYKPLTAAEIDQLYEAQTAAYAASNVSKGEQAA